MIRAFTLLCFLLSSFVPASLVDAQSAISPPASSAQTEELVVAPGDALEVVPPGSEVEVEAALDGGPLQPVRTHLTAPKEGDHWLAVASRDAVGQASAVRWIRLRVDGQAPELTLTTEPELVSGEQGGRFLPPGSRAVARAEDNLAGVAKVGLSSGQSRQEVEADTVTLQLPDSGTFPLSAWAEDTVGNRALGRRLKVSIDGEAPSGQLRYVGRWVQGSSGPVLGPNASVAVDVVDAGSGVESWEPTVDGLQAPKVILRGPWAAGEHSVAVSAVDKVGNRGEVGRAEFVVDTAAPKIRWQPLAEGFKDDQGQTFFRPPLQLRIEAEDFPAGVHHVQWAEGTGEFRELEGDLIEISDGRLTLRAMDQVGNGSSLQIGLLLDGVAPTLSLRLADGTTVAAGQGVRVARGDWLQLAVEEAGAGLARAVYRLGDEPEQPLAEKVQLQQRGRFVLQAELEDGVGNSWKGYWMVSVGREPRGGSGR